MVIKNYLYNLIYQLLTIILPVITIPYVSRILGAEGLGIYALTNTYAQYFVLIGMLGLSIYSSREIAYVRDDSQKVSKVFWEINLLRFKTMGIALIMYLLIFGFVYDSDYKIVYLIQTFVILSSFVDISWLFTGLEDFKRVVTVNTLIKISGVILIFLFVKNSSQVWLYSLILGGCQFIGQIIMWMQIPKNIHFVKVKSKDSKIHLKSSIKLFIPQIAINVYTMLDKIMLGSLSNEAQVGMYDNSQRVIKVLVTVVTALATVTIPKMANLYKNNRHEEFTRNVYKSFSFVSFLSFPMTFGLIAICRSFVPWFYGSGFEDIVSMFYIGSFLMITLGWTSILGNQVLISIKREKEFTIAVTCGAIINVILNFMLIKKYQGIATTISSVVAEYIGMVIMVYFLRDIVDIKKLFMPTIKYLISSIFMALVISYLYSYMTPSVIVSVILAVAGGIIYLILMIVTKDKNLLYGYNFIRSNFIRCSKQTIRKS